MSPLFQQVSESEGTPPLPRNRPFPRAQWQGSIFFEACLPFTRPPSYSAVAGLWKVGAGRRIRSPEQPWEPGLRDRERGHPPGKANETERSVRTSLVAQQPKYSRRQPGIAGPAATGTDRSAAAAVRACRRGARSELLVPLAEGRGLPAITGLHWLLGWRPRPAASKLSGSESSLRRPRELVAV